MPLKICEIKFRDKNSELLSQYVFGFPIWSSEPKVMRQQLFPAILMALLLFGGVASGQGHYELQEQGQRTLQGSMVNREQQSLDGSKTIDSKAKNKRPPRAADVKKHAKGTIPKPGSFGPSSRQYGMGQAKGRQIGSSGSSLLSEVDKQTGNLGSTSFLDGYLLKSLHNDGSARKKSRSEDKPKNDLPIRGKATPYSK